MMAAIAVIKAVAAAATAVVYCLNLSQELSGAKTFPPLGVASPQPLTAASVRMLSPRNISKFLPINAH